MAMEKRGLVTITACDCCGAIGPVSNTPFLASYRARKQEWETPGVDRDGEPEEGYVRCPLCVASDVWPRECCVPEWHGGPTIRLADEDDAVTLPLDDVPEALVVEGRP